MAYSSSEVLQKLSSLLGELPERTSAYGDFNDPDYSEQFSVTRKLMDIETESCCLHLSARIGQLLQRVPYRQDPVTIGSIGCGDCTTDVRILTKVAEKFPLARIHFVGIDINAESCARAKKNLASIPYQTTIRNEDILKIDNEKIPKFDFVSLKNVLYFFNELDPLFRKVSSILKEDGEVEVIAERNSPHWQLSAIFWAKEMKFPVRFVPDLMSEFDRMGFECTLTILPGQMDLSAYVRDKFSSEADSKVLDFLCHTKLEQYPPLVKELCIEYFTLLYQGGQCEEFHTKGAITIKMH